MSTIITLLFITFSFIRCTNGMQDSEEEPAITDGCERIPSEPEMGAIKSLKNLLHQNYNNYQRTENQINSYKTFLKGIHLCDSKPDDFSPEEMKYDNQQDENTPPHLMSTMNAMIKNGTGNTDNQFPNKNYNVNKRINNTLSSQEKIIGSEINSEIQKPLEVLGRKKRNINHCYQTSNAHNTPIRHYPNNYHNYGRPSHYKHVISNDQLAYYGPNHQVMSMTRPTHQVMGMTRPNHYGNNMATPPHSLPPISHENKISVFGLDHNTNSADIGNFQHQDALRNINVNYQHFYEPQNSPIYDYDGYAESNPYATSEHRGQTNYPSSRHTHEQLFCEGDTYPYLYHKIPQMGYSNPAIPMFAEESTDSHLQHTYARHHNFFQHSPEISTTNQPYLCKILEPKNCNCERECCCESCTLCNVNAPPVGGVHEGCHQNMDGQKGAFYNHNVANCLKPNLFVGCANKCQTSSVIAKEISKCDECPSDDGNVVGEFKGRIILIPNGMALCLDYLSMPCFDK